MSTGREKSEGDNYIFCEDGEKNHFLSIEKPCGKPAPPSHSVAHTWTAKESEEVTDLYSS